MIVDFASVCLVIVLAPLVVTLLIVSAARSAKLAASLGAALVCAVSLGSFLAAASEVHPRLVRAALLLSVHASTNLLLYLPSLAFWSGYLLLLRGRLGPAPAFQLRWLLLAASLLMLNQYPRFDETHLLFSGPLIWLPAAFAEMLEVVADA